MVNINKDFSGVNVLKDINFDLKRGEIHAIIGQNGAGKSVLMKILDGVYTRSSGKIIINGKEVNYSTPMEARKLGIGMIFQEFSLIPGLTVAKNIFLNREIKKGILVKDRDMIKTSKDILESLGVNINPRRILRDLPVSYKQLVEIAKVISQDRIIIIMDEPTASLVQSEVQLLNKVIKKLKEKGISIIYITHHLKEIFEICDRVTVIRDGKNILTKKINETDLPQLIEAMLGKKVKELIKFQSENPIGRDKVPILEVKDLDLGGKEKVSFKLWPREVLGFAGLMGAGQNALVKAIFGIYPNLKKELYIHGKKVNIKKPEDSLKYKITMVPEERQTQGLIIDHTIKDNIILSILNRLKGILFFSNKRANDITKKFVNDLNIVTTTIYKKVKLLSGGNQQKVVISKNLAVDPDIIILNDPNFGVDVGSKQDILQLIRNFGDKGKSAIFISSEFEEMANVCDRVIIMKERSIAKEFIRNKNFELTEELLVREAQ
ncbi:MAG: sugar ABC transporter ATP-binding protein [Actinobacteria bacterium]|nr:sugar ABC transporter ATP-binding protein [Actinomycetota bacterium]